MLWGVWNVLRRRTVRAILQPLPSSRLLLLLGVAVAALAVASDALQRLRVRLEMPRSHRNRDGFSKEKPIHLTQLTLSAPRSRSIV
jgi:hypothetical protein